MSAGVATRSRMPFSIGSTTVSVRVFPQAFVSFGKVKYGCRVAFEEAAKVSRRGSGGFCFTSLSPSCRIRGRNSSANQKRSQSRRVRDRPLSETHNRTGEDGRDNQTTVHDAQTLATAAEERLPLGDGGAFRSQGSGSSTDASIAEVEETDENGASSGVPVERLPASSGYRESSGVNDLMLLVKEAETNIRTLNHLRERAVDELRSARNEKEDLQSQVEILKVCSVKFIFS
jgi:hypothetical protein